jgi:hypothetical protein
MYEVYLERAEQLSGALSRLREENKFPSAMALLAVHKSIAFNDALLAKLTGKVPKGKDHETAVDETERTCSTRKLDRSGLSQLRKLISAKSKVSYGDQRTSIDMADYLYFAAERFETWARERLKEIR